MDICSSKSRRLSCKFVSFTSTPNCQANSLSSEIAELEATSLAPGPRSQTRQRMEDIVNCEANIYRIRALLADPRPLAIASHEPTLYVVESYGLSNFGKTYVELFGEFCQLAGDMLEDEDIPIFMKETEVEDEKLGIERAMQRVWRRILTI
jgi:hypothetical protein